ncbi:TPA: hypothetical protein HA235_03905 [Candidatus Woesearchaeota archaeon]|nr:hypothetical protein [uncultured archaeon]MBS3173321.1 hypothetical protein [Candidatus Woesearchaeota archaeon]HIH31827.1 hypothetical protein [Candidatus Woesearchaeota archaeon]HIH55458.1 hypothetical protein [Candidatus Woesearchaeota archaeon]HIJ01900.1 hypothetical protein [Candidatus Woesearchaeota archaeon]
MGNCEDCQKTIRTGDGEISVDMCKMLGTCTCTIRKIAVKQLCQEPPVKDWWHD